MPDFNGPIAHMFARPDTRGQTLESVLHIL